MFKKRVILDRADYSKVVELHKDDKGPWAYLYPTIHDGRCDLQPDGTVKIEEGFTEVRGWRPYPAKVLELNRKAKWQHLWNTLRVRVAGHGTTWHDIQMALLGVLVVICLLGLSTLIIYMLLHVLRTIK